MTRRLGAWDCPYCDQKRILGNVFDCPGCGHPRPRGIYFYAIPDGPIVTPEIAKELGSGGPNWYCEHCNSGNKDNNSECWKCGAPRGTSPSHEVKNYLEGDFVPQSAKEAKLADANGKSWVPASIENAVQEAPEVPEEVDTEISTVDKLLYRLDSKLPENIDLSKLKPYLLGVGAILLTVLISVLVYLFFFKTQTVAVQVSDYHWNQSVSVAEYQVFHETSWTTHPFDAYNVTSSYMDTGRDVKVTDGYRTITVMDTCPVTVYESRTCTGTRDNGDGSFDTYSYECGSSRTVYESCTRTEQEEIYHYEDVWDWFFTYDINRWGEIQHYPTSGNDHSPFYFSDFVLKDPYNGKGIPEIGQQKMTEIPGDYKVTFVSKNRKIGDKGYFDHSYSREVWDEFIKNKDYPIKINFFNVILSYPSP